MRLRIEDTDLKRSTDAAKQAILDGLNWLGVIHHGDIVYQSANAARHAEVAQKLHAAGHAYYDTLSDEEVQTHRDASSGAGKAYHSPMRDNKDAGHNAPLRFRIPDEDIVIQDGVAGEVRYASDQIEDFVLLRADGTPTYMLAVVVDDHDMDVTHVIRGDDHLNNTPKQQLIYEALGWDVPDWAHVPLIHGPDGKKLSKRHGALGVEAYRDMGYLPAAMRNYLVRLGWSHADEEIFFTDDDIAKVFSITGINNSPSRLDFDKMDFVNGQQIEHISEEALIEAALPFLLAERGQDITPQELARIHAALPTLRPRAKTLPDFARVASYLFDQEPIVLEGKWAKPLRREGVTELLEPLTKELESLEDPQWTVTSLQSLFDAFVSARDIGFGKIGQPVRAALTRGLPSPDLSDVLALLGRDETLARLGDALNKMRE